MLEKYRKEIDDIDYQIIELLAKRFKIVKEIWQYKKENGLAPLQPSRWNQVLKTRKEFAKKFWISEKFIEDIWNRIHDEALNIESNSL
jgi:chorismate mutase